MTPAYLSPEWILLIGDDRSTDIAEASVREDLVDVHRATDEATVAALLARRKPSIAFVDLDLTGTDAIVISLEAAGVPLVILGSSASLAAYRGTVPYVMEKPFSAKGISKMVNWLLGRK